MRDNSGNTHGNYGNTHDKLCKLKLNDMDYHVNCHVRFGTQVSAQIGVPRIIVLEISNQLLRLNKYENLTLVKKFDQI